MIDRWRKLLLCLGITPNYKGFHFLLTCLELLQSDPMALLQVTKSLYPVVAKHHNTSWRTVERDLRTVVNLSFQVNPTYLGTLARGAYLACDSVFLEGIGGRSPLARKGIERKYGLLCKQMLIFFLT